MYTCEKGRHWIKNKYGRSCERVKNLAVEICKIIRKRYNSKKSEWKTKKMGQL